MLPMRMALVVLAALVLLPLLNLVAGVSPRELAGALAAPATGDAVRVSLLASLLATGIAALLGIPAGYLLSRERRWWRLPLLFGLALPLALPPIASGIVLLGLVGSRRPLGAWLAEHGIRIVDSFGGVVLAEFFVAGSLVAIAATAAFSEIDASLIEAARTLGASPLRILRTVAIPLALPGIAAGVLLAWLRALGEYGATSVVAYHPTSLPIALYVALSADGVPRALALSELFFVLTGVALATVWLFRRRPA